MRDDIYREVFDELCKITTNVCHRDIQRFLNLNEPVALGDLISGEQILLLGHLGEGVRVDGTLAWKQVIHQAFGWCRSFLSDG